MNYNQLNTHSRDSLLHFDPAGHIYTCGDRQLTPVTTVVESQFPRFDVDYWAPRKAVQEGITEEEIRRRWEAKAQRARDLGTEMHAAIERYYLGEGTASGFDTCHLFKSFTETCTLHPYRTEWSVFDEDLGVAGTIDFLEYCDGAFRIYDWKRSDKLIFCGRPVTRNSFGNTGLGALCHVPDTAFWHYALQLSIYRYILSRKYGINAESGSLVVLHPHNTVPYVIKVPYLERELKAIFPGR